MKKLIFSLSKAKEFKDDLESGIESINKKIQKNNTCKEADIELLVGIKNAASKLLVNVFVLMQKYNLKRYSLFCPTTNAHTIKRLSELQRELKHLNNITISSESTEKKVGKSKSGFKSHISQEMISDRTRTVQRKIDVLQRDLTKFNSKYRIKIKLTPEVKKVLSYIQL